jgi:hypothetical protein
MRLEYLSHFRMFCVNGVLLLAWTSEKGTSIEVIEGTVNSPNAEREYKAGLLLQADITRKVGTWMRKNRPGNWKSLSSLSNTLSTSTLK